MRIVSTSPGLILALAGLLFAAMVQYTARPIELRDAPVYLRNGPSTDALSPPLELPHTVDQVLKKEVKKTNVDDTCK